MNLNDCSVSDLVKHAREEKLRIELVLEPNGYGQTRETLTIEPWEPFEPRCPYGEPIVYVKDKRDNE